MGILRHAFLPFECCFQETCEYVMFETHTVSLTHWDSLEQLPVSCTDGQNTYSMLYVFWMHCTDCICSAVCYSKHLNTWPLIKIAVTAQARSVTFCSPGEVLVSLVLKERLNQLACFSLMVAWLWAVRTCGFHCFKSQWAEGGGGGWWAFEKSKQICLWRKQSFVHVLCHRDSQNQGNLERQNGSGWKWPHWIKWSNLPAQAESS